MKTREREEARRLRREEGRSVKEIEKLLCVSRSSVSRWVRGIDLRPDQRVALLVNGRAAAVAHRMDHYRRRRLWSQEEGRAFARRGDPVHAAGCMLYWAEGSKSRNHVALSNSDPEVVRFFVRFLRSYFPVPDEKLRVWCNFFADHLERQREIEQFWLDLVELPRSCLTKSAVNTYSRYSKRKRLNLLPYGTCRVSVCSTPLVQHIFGAIQEYGGFERPEWLG
jgi:hypothetical protein